MASEPTTAVATVGGTREGEVAHRRVGLRRAHRRPDRRVEVGEAAGHVDEVVQVVLLGDDLVHEAADERLGQPRRDRGDEPDPVAREARRQHGHGHDERSARDPSRRRSARSSRGR